MKIRITSNFVKRALTPAIDTLYGPKYTCTLRALHKYIYYRIGIHRTDRLLYTSYAMDARRSSSCVCIYIGQSCQCLIGCDRRHTSVYSARVQCSLATLRMMLSFVASLITEDRRYLHHRNARRRCDSLMDKRALESRFDGIGIGSIKGKIGKF